MTTITDEAVSDWLERASKHKSDTGMVHQGILLVERLIKENGELRVALKASVTANVMYEVLEDAHHDLLQAGKDWVSGFDVYGHCAVCGECAQCTLATMIEEASAG